MANPIPDVPTFSPVREKMQESPALPVNTDTVDGGAFVPQTLRVSGFVAVIIATLLAATGRNDLVLPFVGGAGLGAALIWSLEKVVRGAFGANTVLAEKGVVLHDAPVAQKKFSGKGALLLFALIKYPAVAILIFFVARTGTQAQVIAFVSGFVCLQLIIGLRGLGVYLLPQVARK